MNKCTFLLFPNYILILTTNITQCFPPPYEGENRYPHLDRALLQEPMRSSKSHSASTEGGRDHFQVRPKDPSSRTEEENHLPAPWKEQVLGPSIPGGYFTITSGISRPAASDWLSHCVACDFLLNPSGAAVRNWLEPRVLIDLLLVYMLLFFKPEVTPKENPNTFTDCHSWPTSAR